MNPQIPPTMRAQLFFYKEGFGVKLHMKVDMPLNNI